MSRAPFQVLVFLYRFDDEGSLLFALFRRSDLDVWQGVAGGGEGNETPEDAARREAEQEAGVSSEASLVRLDSVASIPVEHFRDRYLWDPGLYVIPEYSFGMAVADSALTLSDEHTEYRWLSYEEAHGLLRWDSNRVALWELHRRLTAPG
jgi:dATP pyrophosphohydrolase